MSISLKIHHIDVGQGDATLIIVKEGQNKATSGSEILQAVLIDGGKSDREGLRILAYLKKKLMHWPSGYDFSNPTDPVLKTLDAIICTHYDQDHWGGLPVIIESELCGVETETRIYDQGVSGRPYFYGKYIKDRREEYHNINWVTEKVSASTCTIDKKDLNYLLQPENNKIFYHGSEPALPSMTCIAVNRYVVNNPDNQIDLDKSYGSDANQKSLAFVISYGNFHYYTGGDICVPEEKEIAAFFNSRTSPMQAFKVSHHGSVHSTPKELVDTAKEPCVAFISYGDNTFDHPRSIVFRSLQENENIKKIYLTGNLDFNRMKRIEDLESFINGMVLFGKDFFLKEVNEYLLYYGYFRDDGNEDNYTLISKFFMLKDWEQMEEESSIDREGIFNAIKNDLGTNRLSIEIGLDSKENSRNVAPGTIVLTIDERSSINGDLTVNYDRFQYKEDENIKKADIKKILNIMFKRDNTEALQDGILEIVLSVNEEETIDLIQNNPDIRGILEEQIFGNDYSAYIMKIGTTYIYRLANEILKSFFINRSKLSIEEKIENALHNYTNNYIYISEDFISGINDVTKTMILTTPNKLALANFIQTTFLKQATLQLKNSMINLIKINSLTKKTRLYFGEGFGGGDQIRKITDTILKED